MPIILFIFAAFTNLNFIFMTKLQTIIEVSKYELSNLEYYLERSMRSVETDVDFEGSSDSALLQDYNTCGFILAAIRDIKKELEQDA